MELSRHLIVDTDPVSDQKAVIVGDGYRITVLSDRLFRVETSKSNTFIDEATEGVWFRRFEVPSFQVDENPDCLIVKTKECSLVFYKTKKKAVSVRFRNGFEVKVSNKNNLKGTYRTLDMTDGNRHILKGKIRLSDGVVSSDGVSVLEDDGLFLSKDGKVKPRDVDTHDLYVFCYGKDYRGAVNAYYRITGQVPLIPRFALGNWWSRYKAYTEEEYVSLMERFIDSKIPITVATVDMDWHWVDVKGKFDYQRDWKNDGMFQKSGWTGYSWNTDLFPDYRGFLNWLKEHGFHVTLNLHPAQGVRPFENQYQDMADELHLDTSLSKKTIPFDITSTEFINAYFKILHKPYEKDGVDFFWIDWQQGTKSNMKGLDPLWSLNHYHYLDNSKSPDGKEKRPLILSRFSGIGSHRYPLGFSGDTVVSWKSLDYQPYFTATASNIGYTWWSHDIGGHMAGIKDNELYIRWLQLGVFSPINRLHSSDNELSGKEPWKYDGETERTATFFLRLRHRLLPYLYTMDYSNHEKGIALCEPMYYSYPDIPDAYKVKNQYRFGSELIVCPITEKSEEKTRLAKVRAWIPEGRWTDVFTGYIYHGDRMVDLYRDTTSIPVLAKEGAIIPLVPCDDNSTENPTELEILAYHGDGEFLMYEDDNGVGSDNHAAFTGFRQMEKAGNLFVIEPVQGDVSVVPSQRNYTISFQDIVDGKVSVFVNGNGCDGVGILERHLEVILKGIRPTDRVEIRIDEPKYLTNPSIREFGIEILSKIQGRSLKKAHKYKPLQKTKTDGEFIDRLKKSRFSKSEKGAVMELSEK